MNNNKTKAAAFYSFGCRTNKEEIDAIASQFRANGYNIIYDESNFNLADFIVVNTCSVTQTSENKNVRFINSLKKKYPQAKIIATGCLAQQNSPKLKTVDFLVGNTKKNEIFDIIKREKNGVFIENINEKNILQLPDFIENPQTSDRTRFSIKIEEGCNSFCSYCIVPYLRGTPKSANFDEIISLAKNAIYLGYNEIVLTGTHIGQYANSQKTFLDIAESLISADKNIRIRLSSMNPVDCDEKLFEFMIKNPQICRHLHIAVQSLSADVLTAMNRKSDAIKNLFENLKKYRNSLPNLNLGGDFLVGFPNESKNCFLETCENIIKFNFNYGHIFSYSPRPNTPAAEMKNQIDEKTKKQRSEILRKIISEQKEKFANLQIGKREKIIIEKDGELNGITGNYLRVKGEKNPKFKKNKIVEVVLKKYNLKDNSFEADGKNYF
ncbi:MAG: tRNA (N(6)-L-threonylcarbamoyladenosine(37)-C(2))-methylthiotransferase MtaB [Chitinivibrionia bacterium]|nr:tRNA (N(6)-L-threonylcarbamoyladenosine(37)-C(2))-methylthiotransferase MtaB [Chitinivibrionia bacterium]